jgi:carbon storage regulator
MLVLSRKLQEAIVISDHIIVRVLEVNRDTVKLGIEAPPNVPVHRDEVQSAPPPEPKRKRESRETCRNRKTTRSHPR